MIRYREHFLKKRVNLTVVCPCLDLRCPYSGCLVDWGREEERGKGKKNTKKLINPFLSNMGEGFLLSLVVRSYRWYLVGILNN